MLRLVLSVYDECGCAWLEKLSVCLQGIDQCYMQYSDYCAQHPLAQCVLSGVVVIVIASHYRWQWLESLPKCCSSGQ